MHVQVPIASHIKKDFQRNYPRSVVNTIDVVCTSYYIDNNYNKLMCERRDYSTINKILHKIVINPKAI